MKNKMKTNETIWAAVAIAIGISTLFTTAVCYFVNDRVSLVSSRLNQEKIECSNILEYQKIIQASIADQFILNNGFAFDLSDPDIQEAARKLSFLMDKKHPNTNTKMVITSDGKTFNYFYTYKK